jgi:nucleoside phosphorylase
MGSRSILLLAKHGGSNFAMDIIDNEEALVFINQPLQPTKTAVTLSILSGENILKDPENATRGGPDLPQKTVFEGRVTFNPRGDRIFFIPPLASEPLFAPDRGKWDLYLVSLPFTLHTPPDNRFYEEVTFFVELATPDAQAFDLFPHSIMSEVEETKTYTLSPQIKFREVEASLGQIGKQLQFKGLRPTITAFGEGESTFYWVHQGFKEQKAVTPETKHALIVLQVPRGTPLVEGKIYYKTVIAKKMLGEWRKKDGFVNDYPIRWELQDAPPFFKVSQDQKTQVSGHLSYFDICIFCALAEEADTCMKEIERQCGVSFQPAFSPNTGTYHHATIQNKLGEPLTIHISWQPRPGPVEAGLHIKPVLEEFKPSFAAMTGICAGDRRKVKLGDLIIAESAFAYDTGKMVIGKDGQSQLLHDMDVWHPSPDALHFARMFQQWKPAVARIPGPSSQHHLRSELHIAPMASGNTVRGDNPFDEIRLLARNAIAIDMESATFYRTVAEFPGVRSLLAKGISDYADGEKNDSYHEYASAVPAAYILSFVGEYVTSDRISRLRIGSH